MKTLAGLTTLALLTCFVVGFVPTAAADPDAAVLIVQFRFEPTVVIVDNTVNGGAQITFVNADNIVHDLQSVVPNTFTNNLCFNAPPIALSNTVTVSAACDETVTDYICTIHNFMRGTVVFRDGL